MLYESDQCITLVSIFLVSEMPVKADILGNVQVSKAATGRNPRNRTENYFCRNSLRM